MPSNIKSYVKKEVGWDRVGRAVVLRSVNPTPVLVPQGKTAVEPGLRFRNIYVLLVARWSIPVGLHPVTYGWRPAMRRHLQAGATVPQDCWVKLGA
jgi:hypothetical protein